MEHTNGEYARDQRLILYRLDGLTRELSEARKDINGLKLAFASRAATWGAVGSLPALIIALVALIKLFR